MKMTALSKTLICFSLLTLSNYALCNNNQRNLTSLYSENVIIDCARYVIGAENPNLTDKEYLQEYLIYLGVDYSDKKKIVNYLLAHPRMLSSDKIEQFIKLLSLGRNFGVTLCAIQSNEHINHIKEQVNKI
ncbi:MAG: hypothetical protein PV362_17200 [Providencia heimbachae]|nr:hypothetical protein [Providencia heimbachae]